MWEPSAQLPSSLTARGNFHSCVVPADFLHPIMHLRPRTSAALCRDALMAAIKGRQKSDRCLKRFSDSEEAEVLLFQGKLATENQPLNQTSHPPEEALRLPEGL